MGFSPFGCEDTSSHRPWGLAVETHISEWDFPTAHEESKALRKLSRWQAAQEPSGGERVILPSVDRWQLGSSSRQDFPDPETYPMEPLSVIHSAVPTIPRQQHRGRPLRHERKNSCGTATPRVTLKTFPQLTEPRRTKKYPPANTPLTRMSSQRSSPRSSHQRSVSIGNRRSLNPLAFVEAGVTVGHAAALLAPHSTEPFAWSKASAANEVVDPGRARPHRGHTNLRHTPPFREPFPDILIPPRHCPKCQTYCGDGIECPFKDTTQPPTEINFAPE